MEDPSLGAIKLKYNNEVIKIKDLILQAKIRAINHLSRKLKLLKTRKGNEVQLEKNKRKIESFIAEIKLLKSLQRNEVANFAMDNIENLNKYLNASSATKEKAMARLLSREPINSKCKELKGNFSIVPTSKLLEQNQKKVRRKNRLKALKEKNVTKDVKVDGEKNNITVKSTVKKDKIEKINKPKGEKSNAVKNVDIVSTSDFQVSITKPEDDVEVEHNESSDAGTAEDIEIKYEPESSNESFDDSEIDEPVPSPDNNVPVTNVDPFFIKKGGSDYLTLAAPRPPDKIVGGKYSNDSMLANRKMRRAAKFNRDVVPREKKKPYKPKLNPKYDAKDNDRFNSSKHTDNDQYGKRKNFNERDTKPGGVPQTEEKLHPSWEAKKQKSSILPFQGNKIVFD